MDGILLFVNNLQFIHYPIKATNGEWRVAYVFENSISKTDKLYVKHYFVNWDPLQNVYPFLYV